MCVCSCILLCILDRNIIMTGCFACVYICTVYVFAISMCVQWFMEVLMCACVFIGSWKCCVCVCVCVCVCMCVCIGSRKC